jgi:hypothetical protein
MAYDNKLAQTDEGSGRGEGADIPPVPRRAGHARRLTPIYVLHKAKVPMLTFELSLNELSPLALRALDRLPRHAGTPALRSLRTEDERGFTFTFRVTPRELTVAALPTLLERWHEKHEVARAQAGLTPKAVRAAEPLRPRSPRRKKVAGDDEHAETVVTDLGIVQAAIGAHDAAVISSTLVGKPEGRTASGTDGGEEAEAQENLFVVQGAREEEARAPEPDWQHLAPLCLEHTVVAGAEEPEMPQDWRAWVHAQVRIRDDGASAVALHGLSEDPRVPPALADQAGACASTARAWLAAASETLVECFDNCLRVMPAEERRAAGRAAAASAPANVATLDLVMLDMQMPTQLALAANKQLLGMPGWALQVRQVLVTQARSHERFHAAPTASAALDMVDRWCAALAPVQLTEQAGLFAQPQSEHLHRQLAYLVHHARQWHRDRVRGNARDDCARGLAVWLAWAPCLQQRIETPPKKPARGGLNREPPGSD